MHDNGTRAQARTIYEAHGATRASQVTGIPIRTVRRWAKAEQWPGPNSRATRQPSDQGVAPVADTRQPLQKGSVAGWQPHLVLERLAGELWAQLDTLAGLRAAGKGRDARDIAVVVGVLTDKCLELAKQTGMGSGHPDPATAVARIHQMLDAIEQRRTRGGH